MGVGFLYAGRATGVHNGVYAFPSKVLEEVKYHSDYARQATNRMRNYCREEPLANQYFQRKYNHLYF